MDSLRVRFTDHQGQDIFCQSGRTPHPIDAFRYLSDPAKNLFAHVREELNLDGCNFTLKVNGKPAMTEQQVADSAETMEEFGRPHIETVELMSEQTLILTVQVRIMPEWHTGVAVPH